MPAIAHTNTVKSQIFSVSKKVLLIHLESVTLAMCMLWPCVFYAPLIRHRPVYAVCACARVHVCLFRTFRFPRSSLHRLSPDAIYDIACSPHRLQTESAAIHGMGPEWAWNSKSYFLSVAVARIICLEYASAAAAVMVNWTIDILRLRYMVGWIGAMRAKGNPHYGDFLPACLPAVRLRLIICHCL